MHATMYTIEACRRERPCGSLVDVHACCNTFCAGGRGPRRMQNGSRGLVNGVSKLQFDEHVKVMLCAAWCIRLCTHKLYVYTVRR